MIAAVLATVARAAAGSSVRWTDEPPDGSPRIYIANHQSHLDFILIWSYLPAPERRRVRPVAAADYWSSGPRRYLAEQVFRAILIQRRPGPEREPQRLGEAAVRQMSGALGEGASLILFPEGTRSVDGQVGQFRSGLFHLCQASPGVAVVPVYLDNLNRIMPKGSVIPVPLLSRIVFGPAFRLDPGEGKDGFLARARERVVELAPA